MAINLLRRKRQVCLQVLRLTIASAGWLVLRHAGLGLAASTVVTGVFLLLTSKPLPGNVHYMTDELALKYKSHSQSDSGCPESDQMFGQ